MPKKLNKNQFSKPKQSAIEVVNDAHPAATDDKSKITKPFLKWVGGKTQIIEDVMALFPTTPINNYYEPFLGGGSVLLATLSYKKEGKLVITGQIYASDANPYLIAVYKNIQSRHAELITALQTITDEYLAISELKGNRKPANLNEAKLSKESYYYWQRTQMNSMTSDQRKSVPGSALLIFLNKTCFRGVYREGPNGFNVPFGNYKEPAIFDKNELAEISELIRNVVFTHADFATEIVKAKSGDFLYLDPPYAPKNSKSFVDYTSSGFSLEKHQQLFKQCHDLTSRNIKFLMSNSDAKLVVDSFPGPRYITRIILCKRTINSKNPDEMTNEVLITN